MAFFSSDKRFSPATAIYALAALLIVFAAFLTYSLLHTVFSYGNADGAVSAMGGFLFSVYGFSSFFVPAFLFASAIILLVPGLNFRTCFLLSVSVVPFFTAYGGEKLIRGTSAITGAAFLSSVIFMGLLISVVLAVVTEYLLFFQLATLIERKELRQQLTKLKERVRSMKKPAAGTESDGDAFGSEESFGSSDPLDSLSLEPLDSADSVPADSAENPDAPDSGAFDTDAFGAYGVSEASGLVQSDAEEFADDAEYAEELDAAPRAEIDPETAFTLESYAGTYTDLPEDPQGNSRAEIDAESDENAAADSDAPFRPQAAHPAAAEHAPESGNASAMSSGGSPDDFVYDGRGNFIPAAEYDAYEAQTQSADADSEADERTIAEQIPDEIDEVPETAWTALSEEEFRILTGEAQPQTDEFDEPENDAYAYGAEEPTEYDADEDADVDADEYAVADEADWQDARRADYAGYAGHNGYAADQDTYAAAQEIYADDADDSGDTDGAEAYEEFQSNGLFDGYIAGHFSVIDNPREYSPSEYNPAGIDDAEIIDGAELAEDSADAAPVHATDSMNAASSTDTVSSADDGNGVNYVNGADDTGIADNAPAFLADTADTADTTAERPASSGVHAAGNANAGNTNAEASVPAPAPVPPRRKSWRKYHIDCDILTTYPDGEYWVIDEETHKAAAALKETLNEFNIQADVTGIRKGPVITMFEILPAPGVKLSRIVGLQDNIALRLAASSVRIVAPIPGKHAVGIEVPNHKRAIVSFRELIETDSPAAKKMGIPVMLGKDITGEAQIIDLAATPHLLIAGSTGSGKSVCVNSIILSILYKRAPDEVKLILIDPKVVELKLYNDIGHLLAPVITEPKKAFQALQYCLCEMERRYAVLDGMGVRNIKEYNKRILERNIATEKLPYIVVIIDEFADLMATTGKELESTVARLAAMSRAVGIHLVLATQRPSIDVITGLIKANIPSRIAFMVASKTDSRIIIDQVGAEKLLGRGDMLYSSVTDPFPVRIQGAFVSDEEVERVVEEVKTFGEPEYIDDEIFVDEDDEDGMDASFFSDGEDPLYDKALDIVLSAGKASASYIQRRLKIGYNRAARLVEEMEMRGIVGPANGSKPREVIHVPDRQPASSAV